MPLLLIYRRYYGGKLALKLLVVFWAVMGAAGLAVEYLFRALSLEPATRPTQIAEAAFRWNYTTFLNIALLAAAAAMWWLARNQQRLGGGVGYAIDPVCGMQVETATAAVRITPEGNTYYFCAERCRERFENEPTRYAQPSGSATQRDANALNKMSCRRILSHAQCRLPNRGSIEDANFGQMNAAFPWAAAERDKACPSVISSEVVVPNAVESRFSDKAWSLSPLRAGLAQKRDSTVGRGGSGRRTVDPKPQTRPFRSCVKSVSVPEAQ